MLYAMNPLIAKVGNAQEVPFLFNAVINFSATIFCLCLLFFGYKDYFLNKKVWKALLVQCNRWEIWVATIGSLGYAVFALSLNYIDVSVATILFGTKTVLLILCARLLFRRGDRYEKITPEKWGLIFLAFIGLVFVIISQTNAININVLLIFSYFPDLFIWLGVGAALLASLLSSLPTPYSLKWSSEVSKSTKRLMPKTPIPEFFLVIVAFAIARLIGAFISGAIGYSTGESISIDSKEFMIAAASGLFVNGVAAVLSRLANSLTSNLGVNALSYTTPVFALILLMVFSLVSVPHIDLLIIGAAAVVTANLLLNFKAEIRSAYKALIIALWVCGMSVYLHTGFPLPDYVEIVGVIATLFILILAFRVDRLVRRTTEEESNEFFLFHRLSTLAESDGIDKDAPNQLREIGGHVKPSELRNAYDALKQYFSKARGKCTKDDRAMLDELEARVDTLTHSKQQGANFGELTALGFMGFIMVSALLLFKPVELSGWEGLFVETSSFLLATAIVFLFANIFDLQHDRTNAILTKEKGKKYYSVAFDDAGDRGSERWISITVCIAITVAYIWLFLGKWIF